MAEICRMQSEKDLPSDIKAQQLRLQRMAWGFVPQLGSVLVATGLYVIGEVALLRALEFIGASLLIGLIFVGLLKSGINLRFRDPSMTTAQILLPVLPAVYIMYFINDPQGRMAFLLMATAGFLFGMFALSRLKMLIVGGLIVIAYIALLLALAVGAPERVNLAVEGVVVLAYAIVLGVVAWLGTFIAGMRRTLRKQNVALEELATRDQLTQLPNRRSLLSQLAQEKSRLERRKPGSNTLWVGMLDIDHFKQVNDTFGHEAGDVVLGRISEIFQKAIRQGDFVGRFGGEEFVIILPESTMEDVLAVAERIRGLAAGVTFPELSDEKRVTVSIGLARHRVDDPIEKTLKSADEALFCAKSQGRNRVVIADQDLAETEGPAP